MATIEELRGLYEKGQYRELISTIWNSTEEFGDAGSLLLASARHQLGEYEKNLGALPLLINVYPPDTEIGDTARRFLAHGLLQLGKVKEAQDILATLVPSLARTNVRANELLVTARRGEALPILEIRQMLDLAMWSAPHETVCGHIVNNLTFALYEAREREEVKPHVRLLPGLIEVAIAIYQETRAAKNHLAGVLYRANSIFLATPGWERPALGLIDQSIAIWDELVASEGGERYRQNLTGARAQREKNLAALASS
ncbi:MAG: hypothetical protein HYU04_02215 [Candidatus Wildermuthbacteria bacterium]|nr:hypothetical protein [Candidatus Wildermuthbacteria bacterium]